MPASSNFNQAIREAQTSSIVGPNVVQKALPYVCLLYTSPSPRDYAASRMPSSA